MKSNHWKSLASIIADFFKIVACIAVVCVWVHFVHLINSGKILEKDYENSIEYAICVSVVGDHIMTKAYQAAVQKTERLSELATLALQQSDIEEEEKGIADVEQTEEQVALAEQIAYNNKVIESIKREPLEMTGWIYVGAKDKATDLWKTMYIVFDGEEPQVGQRCHTEKPLNLRQSAPSNASGSWQKGKIIGGVPADSFFTIDEIKIIPGTGNRSLWWVKIVQ